MLEYRQLHRRLPAHQRPNPRQQLFETEGLRQIVVGTMIEALDAAFDGIAGAEDQHRFVETVLAPTVQEIESVAVRKAKIEQNHIKRGFRERVERRLAGPDP